MADVLTRLGIDYDERGVREFISSLRNAQIETQALTAVTADLVLVTSTLAFGLPLVIDAVRGLFDMARDTGPEIKILDAAFEKLGQRDDTIRALATILDLTERDAKAALDAAKGNSEYADNLKKVADLQALVLRDREILQNPFSDLRSRQGAQQELDRIGDLALEKEQVQLGITAQRWGEAADAAGEYYKDIARLSSQRANEEEQLSARLGSLAQRQSQAFVRAAEQRARAERDAADQSERIARDLADTIARIMEQQATRLDTIQREYRDREDDLAYQHKRTLEQMALDEVQRARQNAARIEQINRDKARSLQELDFNTHEQLLDAKTNREREDILRRALFERGMLEQRATDQLTDVQRQIAEEKQLYDERRRLAEADYRHQHELNVRETNQKISDARRAAEQQLAYAKKRNAEETADLAKRLAQQKIDIKARYDAEIVAIEAAKTALLAASAARIKAYTAELEMLARMAAAQFKLITTGEAYRNYSYEQQRRGEWNPEPIPNGDDSYNEQRRGEWRPMLPVGGSGGREMDVRGGSDKVKEASPQYVNVTVPDVLRPAFAAMLDQFIRGHVFKDGVKLIMSDESWR